MYKQYFNVAGHVFSIESTEDITEMMPNLKPFAAEGDGAELFSIKVDNDLIPAWRGNKVGVFPCPSATFEVYRLEEGSYRILVSNEHGIPCAFIQSDAARKEFVIATRGNEGNIKFGINNALMVIYTLCSAAYRTLLIHSSVVENSGRAYMFLGVSGSGKSTHSDMWTRHIDGSTLINDDNPVIKITDDGTPVVYGSPWSGKRPVYMDVHYPIGGMAAIVKSKENRIRKESIPTAFGILLSSCSTLKFDKKIHMDICGTITALLERIPVHTLSCRPDGDAAKVSGRAFGL